MSQITDFLPKYRELNTLFADIINSGRIGYWEQQDITEFYKQFGDKQAFEKMLLDIVLEKDKYTYTLILSSIKTEVEKNISLYKSGKEYLNAIDMTKMCNAKANQYDDLIKYQSAETAEYRKEYNQINGSLDAIGYRVHTKEEETGLWRKFESISKLYKEEQAKLSELYDLSSAARKESDQYRENLFEKIYCLSLSFLTILNSYLLPKEVGTELSAEVITLKKEEVSIPMSEVESDMIFRTKMYDKLLVLEKKLIANNYLNSDLRWISVHENGKQDVKRLIIFLTALINNNYFLPNRDPKVKTFFEARYQINIGQNFEKKRREPLADEYKVVFYDYPF